VKLPTANSQLPRLSVVASAFRRKLLLAIVVLALPALASAQFGPSTERSVERRMGPKNNPSRLLLDIEWDGKVLTRQDQSRGRGRRHCEKVTIDYSADDSCEGADRGRGRRRAARSFRSAWTGDAGKTRAPTARPSTWHAWTQGGARRVSVTRKLGRSHFRFSLLSSCSFSSRFRVRSVSHWAIHEEPA
jgi:hypothetical protein